MRVSGLRLGGKGFGQLATIRGTTKYHLSPFEQRAFKGVITHSLPNALRRTYESALVVVPPFLIAYSVYLWGEAEHERSLRKQPGQFDHET